MFPKEKAESLVKKHLTAIAEETMDSDGIILYNAKQCALITVDEVLSAIDQDILSLSANLSRKYFELVKEEIKKLSNE